MKGGSISAMADPYLNGAYIVTEFRNVLSIVVQRTTPNEQERPNMEEVLQKLEETQILSLNFKSDCKNFFFFLEVGTSNAIKYVLWICNIYFSLFVI